MRMSRTLVIYVVGVLSTVLTLVSTVVNGIFATKISPELSEMGALQVASVTGSALSCIAQGFLIFLSRHEAKATARAKRGSSRRGVLGGWIFVLVGVVLCLMAAVVGMAMWWSSARMREIESKQILKLFYAWCALWAASIFCQGLCYGYLLVLSRVIVVRDRDSKLDFHPGVGLGTRSPAEGDEREEPIISESSSLSDADLDRKSKEIEGGIVSKRTQISPASTRTSIDSTTTYSLKAVHWGRSIAPEDMRDALAHLSIEGRPSTHSLRSYTTRATSPDYPFPPLPEEENESESEALRSPSPAAVSTRSSVEEHIHPLFRSDSPRARPVISMGTRVTASPLAGQTISRHTLNRIRSTTSLSLSRERSRSPLVYYEEDEEGERDEEPRRGCVNSSRRRTGP